MPKMPRISSREAIQALERLGFEQVRQAGSHVVLKKETGTIVCSLLTRHEPRANHIKPTLLG